MTTIVHFYGAPCSGKTVAASKLFYELKTHHINVELVTEYAKQWAWENRKINKYDQIYIVANQIHRETVLLDKVDVIVTDSPFPLGSFYEEYYTHLQMTRPMIQTIYNQITGDGHRFLNFWLPYEGFNTELGIGRFHNDTSSRDIDRHLSHWLADMDIPCTRYHRDMTWQDIFSEKPLLSGNPNIHSETLAAATH